MTRVVSGSRRRARRLKILLCCFAALLGVSFGAGGATAQTTTRPTVAPPTVRASGLIRRWGVKILNNKKTGRFSRCAIRGAFRNGVVLLFDMDRLFTWSLLLYDKSWQLPGGDAYDAKITIDDGAPIAVRGHVVRNNAFLIPLSTRVDTLPQLRSGRRMQVQFAGKKLGFSLRGSGAAIKALALCVARNGGVPRRIGDQAVNDALGVATRVKQKKKEWD